MIRLLEILFLLSVICFPLYFATGYFLIWLGLFPAEWRNLNKAENHDRQFALALSVEWKDAWAEILRRFSRGDILLARGRFLTEPDQAEEHTKARRLAIAWRDGQTRIIEAPRI